MKTFRFFSLAIACFILIGLLVYTSPSSTALGQGGTATASAAALPHWAYEGDEGPAEWGKLDPSFAACDTGRAQSPINVSASQKLNLTDIAFNYSPSKLNIFNNGHTIQVNYDAGSSITYNETKYSLLQFHFHHPSEHTINGKSYDMELHFVHSSASGNLAVVGVMIEKGDKDNPAFADIFNNLPSTAGAPTPTDKMVDAEKLLPSSHLYYTYNGSLTTPPCTEGVRWLLLTTPIELSQPQIDAFAKLFEMDARPVQPLNNRDLLADNTAGK